MDTLFVFAHDFRAVQELFPEEEFWELNEEAYLMRFIFEDASEEDMMKLRRTVMEALGLYVRVQPVSDFVSGSVSSGVRTHQVYLLFYIFAAASIVGAMLMNVYRILKKKIPDYIVHHLYGCRTAGLIFNFPLDKRKVLVYTVKR